MCFYLLYYHSLPFHLTCFFFLPWQLTACCYFLKFSSGKLATLTSVTVQRSSCVSVYWLFRKWNVSSSPANVLNGNEVDSCTSMNIPMCSYANFGLAKYISFGDSLNQLFCGISSYFLVTQVQVIGVLLRRYMGVSMVSDYCDWCCGAPSLRVWVTHAPATAENHADAKVSLGSLLHQDQQL